VRTQSIFDLAKEARTVAQKLTDDSELGGGGHLSVSGVLADQLARELGAGAAPGAVQIGGEVPPRSAEVIVRVIAGEPTEADEALVREANLRGIPVVLVQLWTQADWTRPFVLSPFVVECERGKGFPLSEIADRIVDAAPHLPLLVSEIPALCPSAERHVVLRSAVHAAVLGAFKGRMPTRPLIMGEQVRMLARLLVINRGRAGVSDDPAVLGAVTGVVLASGFAFRGVARTARFALPAPLVNAGIAAAGTLALAKAAKVYGSRLAA
jgi:hypothetical protein